MLVTPSRKILRGRRGPTTERGALVSPPVLRGARLLVAACLRFHLTPGGLELLHALIQGNPGQCRALDADWELADPLQRHQLAEVIFRGGASVHHRPELF